MPAPAPCSPTPGSCRRLPDALTQDSLLGGRVRLNQPAEGYRVAIDPVLLAAAVPALPGDQVLDVGSGSGAAALCLAYRVAGCRVTGIELQSPLVRLANDNAALNLMQDRVAFIEGDLLRPPPGLVPGAFAHAMANPPQLAADRAVSSPASSKAVATVEGEARLASWIGFCLAMVRQRGSITLIHRADRLDALLAVLHKRAGAIVVFPLWPTADGRDAKRVLVQARKGSDAPMRLAAGLLLHGPDGGYTKAADAVLREGAALEF